MKIQSLARALVSTALLSTSLFSGSVSAIDVDINSPASIKAAAKTVAMKLRLLYPDNESWSRPGEFAQVNTPDGKNDKGFFWWEGGAVMGGWIEYWYHTGDDQFNDIVTKALLYQVGEDQDYEPLAQTLSLGNDDQAFWGLAVLSAAERGYPDPPADQPQWLALAQAVFNRQSARWDPLNCGGGMRWQIPITNNGYDYKNSISNGLFFHMGARLARYTGNSTYAELAERTYDWCKTVGLIGSDYKVFDGAHIPQTTSGTSATCAVSVQDKWSYNAGVMLSGAAFMYNFTNGAEKWKVETQKLMEAIQAPFFNADNIMRESACDPAPSTTQAPTCNLDQRSFKAYLARFMAYTYQMAPFTQEWIIPRLQASAKAGAATCTGGADGITCGLAWVQSTYDGSVFGVTAGGLGEHLAVMEVLQSNLIVTAGAPLTATTGGTSKGDPTAGTTEKLTTQELLQTEPSTVGDKAGAGILTTIVLGLLFSLTYWLVRF